MKNYILTIFSICLLIFSTDLYSQSQLGQDEDNSVNTITTAVPFLTIAPDGRAGAMGDLGVATSPDANATYWNPAKLAFIDKELGISLSFTPWLRKLIGDMALSYLTGYYKLSEEQAFGFSLLYFDLGSIQFTDKEGNNLNIFNPKEYAISAAYSRKLSENLGVALALKFIHSNLSGNISLGPETETKPGNTAAGDLSVYYQKDFLIKGKNINFATGANISNIGAKISYTNNEEKDFIPTNLRIGFATTVDIDEYNKITFAFDANKLMVPSPPIYDTSNGQSIIASGKDPNRPLLSGIFGSFSDAPGGFKEEMREIMLSFGLEYWYTDLFAVRAGYFNEHITKGNRKYFTLGIGIRYQVFGLDFAYLTTLEQNHPLAETLRFTLLFDFEAFGKQKSIIE